MDARVVLRYLLCSLCIVAAVGCSGSDRDIARRTLEVILEDDLTAIVEDMPESSLRDSVHYHIREYQTYSEGRYGARAVVDFYFLPNGLPKIVRKYRYYTTLRQWERYYNAYRSLQDTTSADGRD